MSESDSKQKYFPLKPKTEEGFKEPVSWLGGRELISSIKWIAVYSIFGENIDPRSWMKSNLYPAVGETAETRIGQAVTRAWADKTVDYWNWKRERFEVWEEYLKEKQPWTVNDQGENEITEFWFDYIADTGDGQQGVYGVGCLCLSDLWIENEAVGADVDFSPENVQKEILLPRGSFLFVGGDTAYHVADYSSLHERFQNPFRWAFASVRKYLLEKYNPKPNVESIFIDETEKEQKPKSVRVEDPNQNSERIFNEEWDGMLSKQSEDKSEVFRDTEPPRPIFAIPANHDYYNDIDGFNRLFRRPPFETVEENKFETAQKDNLPLRIPTFRREQEASYTALRLPFDWWFLGIDSENEKLDFRQKVFYKEIFEKWKPKKLIISTSEPTTVFGRKSREDDKTATYIKTITESLGLKQPFCSDGQFEPSEDNPTTDTSGFCRLDLSGDVHHYARYWGPKDEKFGQEEFASNNYASLVSGGGGAFFDATETLIGKSEVTKNGVKTVVPGEIPPQTTFPDATCSRRATADRIFDLWNIRKGGYVQTAGAVIAVIIFFSLTRVDDIHDFFRQMKFGISGSDIAALIIGFSPFISSIFFFFGAYKLHNLVATLKDERNNDKSSDPDNGRIKQLRIPFLCFAFGVIFYGLFLLLQIKPEIFALSAVAGYTQSLLLLLNFIIAGLLAWMSIEYSNWLPIRFKFSRQFGTEPDGWLDLFITTSLNKEIDKNLSDDSLIKRIWESFKKQSVEYAPVFVLNICAVAVIILGINLFGNRSFSKIGADIVFTVVALGIFFGLISFAVSTGAAYQNGKGKAGFAAIGFWHAILQLLTPFIIVFYGDWRFVIAVFVLSIFTNGLSNFRAVLKFLFPDIVKADSGWKKTLWHLATLRFGAWIMKRDSPTFLAVAWFIYGLVILVTPFLLIRYTAVQTFQNVFDSFVNAHPTYKTSWLPIVLLLLIAGYFGYRMSRVWFSWYLAVSLAFNGHNNEAGGAARIEGYKHILRIKVEPEKLTVYVIGFENAETDLDKLKPKLVDKFVLTCS